MEENFLKNPKRREDIYDQDGRVKDPEVAQSMANIQKDAKEKKPGWLFGPSKEEVQKELTEAEGSSERFAEDMINSERGYMRDSIATWFNHLVKFRALKNPEIDREDPVEVSSELKIKYIPGRGGHVELNGVLFALDDITLSELKAIRACLEEKADEINIELQKQKDASFDAILDEALQSSRTATKLWAQAQLRALLPSAEQLRGEGRAFAQDLITETGTPTSPEEDISLPDKKKNWN